MLGRMDHHFAQRPHRTTEMKVFFFARSRLVAGAPAKRPHRRGELNLGTRRLPVRGGGREKSSQADMRTGESHVAIRQSVQHARALRCLVLPLSAVSPISLNYMHCESSIQ